MKRAALRIEHICTTSPSLSISMLFFLYIAIGVLYIYIYIIYIYQQSIYIIIHMYVIYISLDCCRLSATNDKLGRLCAPPSIHTRSFLFFLIRESFI